MYNLITTISYILFLSFNCLGQLNNDKQLGFPGDYELTEVKRYMRTEAPEKMQGYLSWKYPMKKRGEILATPIEEGNDELDILSVWENNEPAITFLATHSNSFYDKIHIHSSGTLSWDTKIIFSGDSLPTVQQIVTSHNESIYEITRQENRELYFKTQLNDSLFASINLDTTGNLEGDVYIWNSTIEDFTYYFPFEYTINDIEQIFVKNEEDWLELVFSLMDGELEAVARHDSIPYNMKEIIIIDDKTSSAGSKIEFHSSGNIFSKVDVKNMVNELEGIDRIRDQISVIIEEITRSHLEISRDFDIVNLFEMKPIEIIKLSNY